MHYWEQQLTALREAKGLSQVQVATLVRVSQPAVAKLESRTIKNLQVKTLVRMAAALGTQVTIEITPRDQLSVSYGHEILARSWCAGTGRRMQSGGIQHDREARA